MSALLRLPMASIAALAIARAAGTLCMLLHEPPPWTIGAGAGDRRPAAGAGGPVA